MALVLATRLPSRSEHLFSWDSVNFALGMERIDVAEHEPHPPGYIGYIAAARALRLGASENAALLRLNIAAAALSALIVWCFAMRVTESWRGATAAWSLVVTSPLHWFYSGVAEIYAVELLVTLSIAWAAYECIHSPRTRAWPWLLGGAVATALLCKLPAAVLMAPLVLYATIQARPLARAAMMAACSVGVVGALIAIGSVTSPEVLWQLSARQAEGVGATSVLGGFGLRALNQSARDFSYACMAAAGAGGLVAIPLRRRAGSYFPTLFVTIWTVPYIVLCLFVHFPKPGYALPLVAPLALWLGSGFVSAPGIRTVVTIAVMIALNAAHFVGAQPWSAEQTGGPLRYRDRSMAQKLRTELNSIMRPSLSTIRQHDSVVRWFLDATVATCSDTSRVVLVSAGGAVTWRHAMFYIPEAPVVRLPTPQDGVLIAQHHAMQPMATGDIDLRGGCIIFVGGGGLDDVDLGANRERLREVVFGEEKLSWARAPLEMRLLPGGRKLSVRAEDPNAATVAR
ncbi:MAG: hypothetical protein ACRD2X_14425 [Vicinamibacteraceae bacterium]